MENQRSRIEASRIKDLEPMDDAERGLRVNLAAAYRLIALFGWDDLLATHLSVRLPGPEHRFLINPLGLLFEEITASSLVKIDLDGNIVGNSPYQINPAGFTIHSAIHAARADAQCVIHLHTVNGIAVSSQEHGLLPINQTAMLINGRLAYHDFEGIALNHDERPRLVADLDSNNAMILRNHGTLALGTSVADAFQTIYFLERACAIQIAAQAGGAALRTPSDAIQMLVTKQVADFGDLADRLLWPALLRRLDRVNPGYRD